MNPLKHLQLATWDHFYVNLLKWQPLPSKTALLLVTSIKSPHARAGKGDPDCSKTKLNVRLHSREYFPKSFLPKSQSGTEMENILEGKVGRWVLSFSNLGLSFLDAQGDLFNSSPGEAPFLNCSSSPKRVSVPTSSLCMYVNVSTHGYPVVSIHI